MFCFVFLILTFQEHFAFEKHSDEERRGERAKASERHRGQASTYFLSLQAKPKDQKLHPGLSSQWQQGKHLRHHLESNRCISRSQLGRRVLGTRSSTPQKKQLLFLYAVFGEPWVASFTKNEISLNFHQLFEVPHTCIINTTYHFNYRNDRFSVTQKQSISIKL